MWVAIRFPTQTLVYIYIIITEYEFQLRIWSTTKVIAILTKEIIQSIKVIRWGRDTRTENYSHIYAYLWQSLYLHKIVIIICTYISPDPTCRIILFVIGSIMRLLSTIGRFLFVFFFIVSGLIRSHLLMIFFKFKFQFWYFN